MHFLNQMSYCGCQTAKILPCPFLFSSVERFESFLLRFKIPEQNEFLVLTADSLIETFSMDSADIVHFI